MTAVEMALDELAEVNNENWAELVVEAAAFRHLGRSPSCVGYTIFTGGRSACFAKDCGWAISGRLDDRGERRLALFAMTVLGTIGLAVALVEDAKANEIAQRLFS